MCRNIRTLHNFDPPANAEEINAAALQYVRKISGFAKPSQANQKVFDAAVQAIALASENLINELVTKAPKRNREEEAEKARLRAKKRFG